MCHEFSTQKSYDRQFARDNLCPHCFLMGRAVKIEWEHYGEIDHCPRCDSRFKGDDLADAWDEAETYLIIRKADMEEAV